MSIVNTAPTSDVRKVMSGKDGALYDEDGNLLVSIESYQSQVAITNQTYQPLGNAQERSTMSPQPRPCAARPRNARPGPERR